MKKKFLFSQNQQQKATEKQWGNGDDIFFIFLLIKSKAFEKRISLASFLKKRRALFTYMNAWVNQKKVLNYREAI